jgi:hypothetical protein
MEKNLARFACREVHDLSDGRIEDRPGAFDFHPEERLPKHRRARGGRRRRTSVDNPTGAVDTGRGLYLPEPVDLARCAVDSDAQGQAHAL